MARKPKQINVEEEQIPVKQELKNSKEQSTIDLLQKQLLLLQEQLDKLQSEKNSEHVQYSKEENIEDINGKEYIPIMSLSKIPVVITTEPKGQGREFKFEKFGSVKRIMYDDLVKTMYNHPTFFESGRLYIMNPRVIRIHGMDQEYENVLTKEKMEMILNGKTQALELFKGATETQQKIIIRFLVERVRENPASVDMNLVMNIRQYSGVDIISLAEESKSYIIESK